MGHLLETINPESADRIAGPLPPGVGGWVVYVARPGEGRSGSQEFPALVMKRREGSGLDLLVFYGVEDIGERADMPPINEDHPFPGWKFRTEAEPEKFEPSRLNKMREELDSLKSAVLGDYEKPPKSVIDLLADFEKTLREFKKRLAELEA